MGVSLDTLAAEAFEEKKRRRPSDN